MSMSPQAQSPLDRYLAMPSGEESPDKALFDIEKTLLMKSEVPAGLITVLAGAYTIAEMTNSKYLKMFCNLILQLQISKDRKGRVELMESVIARLHRNEDTD